MLELAILGLLKQQPMHGYQLSRELGESLGGFWRVSYGSLYPTLRRLERDGLVAPVAGGSTGGRRKTVFGITEQGERAFLELLQEAPGDSSTEDTRFRVRLAFFRYLPPETRIRQLERRRASLVERLATIESSLRDVLNAAWLSRLDHADECDRIAEIAHELCSSMLDRTSGRKRQPTRQSARSAGGVKPRFDGGGR